MKDPYLLAKALAYAIVAIELRPETIREPADYHDMVLLFRKLPASERELFLDEARRDLTSHRESVSIEDVPIKDELRSNDVLRHAREIVQPKATAKQKARPEAALTCRGDCDDAGSSGSARECHRPYTLDGTIRAKYPPA